MMEFQNHDYGKSEGETRKQVAQEDLKIIFYRKKTTFYFDKYVTKTKQKFDAMENYNVPLYEEDKVRQLLDNINCPIFFEN